MHLAIIVLLLGTLLNDYVLPRTFPWINLLSLMFPVLMILNIVLCIFWVAMWKKRAVFFLLISFIFFKPVQRWVNFTAESGVKPNLKIVTMNIKNGSMGREKLYDYLVSTKADIIIGQECGSELNIPGYPYKTDEYQIVALNSKYRIVKQEKLAKSGNGNSFYADININGKIIRIVNVYLNPFSFDKQKVRPAEDLEENKVKMKYVLKRLIPTFKIHQDEVSDVREAIDHSPYPVILAGDFNSVPNSYEYYTLGKGLTDAFVTAGKGSATSFHDYKFPIRIDYIFVSETIKPVSYRVDRSIKLSDHFPVIAEFKID